MARIFISYSRADRQFVDEFVPLLRRVYGLEDVWYDDQIHGGADWWQVILREVAACNLFVYLLSNDSLASSYCQAEFREALRLRKQILPVITRPKTEYPGSVPDDLAAVLRRTQYVDMTRGFKDHVAISSLYAAVNQWLDLVPAHPQTPLDDLPVEEPVVDDRPARPRFRRRVWAGGAITLVVVMALIVVLIAVLSGEDGSTTEGVGTATPTVESTTAVAAVSPVTSSQATDTDTPIPDPTETLTPEQTDTATITPIPTATDTPELTETRRPTAILPTEWEPVAREFDSVEMVLVPSGCFMMGSDPERDPNALNDERPEHEVCITKGFWLDQYEVTNEAYQTFVDEDGYTRQEFWSDAGWDWLQTNKIEGPRDYEGFTDPKQPRVGVSWYEAEAYARWRGGRLPTEAEWEYAARGPASHIFPWGDEYKPGSANFDAVAVGGAFLETTVSVDRFADGVSWIGAYNMAGNAAEWVLNTFGIYSEEPGTVVPQIVPTGSSTIEKRGIRGGGWEDSLERTRSAFRFFASPSDRSHMYGFRILVPN